jgi:hypothetical protein
MQNTSLNTDAPPQGATLPSLFSARNALKTFGAIGLALGLPYSLLLASYRGLLPSLMFGVAVVALATLISTGYVSILLTGRETLVFYRSIIFIFAAAALIPKLFHRPVLEYLDVTALGSAMFLACGRLGCLSVGCCHGRPSRWGLRYGADHVRTGFAPWLEGVRLFPIQAVESLYVFGIAISGGFWLWRHPVAGTLFEFSIISYAFGRFFFEFFRGDDARPYFLSFSEAQWISALLLSGIFLAGNLRILPAIFLLPKILTILYASVAAILFYRSLCNRQSHRLFSAGHVNEIARAVRTSQSWLASPHTDLSLSGVAEIHLVETTQRLRVSLGRVHRFRHPVLHFSISWSERALAPRDARVFAQLLARLLHRAEPCHIVKTPRGVYHFLFSEPLNSVQRSER